ncbi:MAG: hypothetical protein ACR2PQ_13095 [Myxococcota bacterium]
MSFRCLASVLAAGLLLGLVAAPAAALPPPEDSGWGWSPSPSTLKRSLQNLTQWPLDVVLSPVVAARDIVVNMQEIEDSLAVKIFYPIPGFAWNTMVQGGAGVLRGVTGVIELVPGVILFPFPDAEFGPLFDPAEDNDGLVRWENGIYDLNFGISYTGS